MNESRVDETRLGVSHANWALPMSSYASKAFSSIGILPAQDFSSGYLMGAQYTPLTVSSPDEEHSSSESSFLKAAKGRPNLKVYDKSLAKKVLFDNAKRASGVLLEANGETFRLDAAKEVILSAGAVSCSVLKLRTGDYKPCAYVQQFQSPQLLMVSGVGPRAILENFSIPIVAAREGVGQNMWDHASVLMFQQVDVETQSGLSDPKKAAIAAAGYNINRTGILTSSGADFFGKYRACS